MVSESPEKEILWAAENGRRELVRKLVHEEPRLVDVRDKDGYTPLHRACYNDHLDAVNLLLSYGASVSAKTLNGWEPLHSACHWNHPSCVARLLAAGADVNAHSNGGNRTAFVSFARPRYLVLFSLSDQTPLHIATSVSHCRRMLQLLLAHPDVQPFVKNKSGDSPRDLARRTGIYDYLFDAADPAISYIKSMAFTVNPFIR